MHFRHISTKIQLKNLKQHFDWGAGFPGLPLVQVGCNTINKSYTLRLILGTYSSVYQGTSPRR